MAASTTAPDDGIAPSGANTDPPAINRFGNNIPDPTANVLALVKAANTRTDDVLALNVGAVKDILGLHMHYQDMIRTLSSRHMEERLKEQSDHANELRTIEAARLNAIRAVDVAAVSEAAKVVAAQQLALASQLQTTADTTRIATQSLATSVSETLTTALKPLIEGLAEVQKRQYETAGAKTQQVETRVDTHADRASNQWTISATIALISLLLTLIAVATAVIVATHK